jgi:hypothetical protein
MTNPRILARQRMQQARLRKSLAALGFADLEAYFASSLWASLRANVLKKRRGRCDSCGEPTACQVRHRSYSLQAMTGERSDRYGVYCESCDRGEMAVPSLEEAALHKRLGEIAAEKEDLRMESRQIHRQLAILAGRTRAKSQNPFGRTRFKVAAYLSQRDAASAAEIAAATDLHRVQVNGALHVHRGKWFDRAGDGWSLTDEGRKRYEMQAESRRAKAS